MKPAQKVNNQTKTQESTHNKNAQLGLEITIKIMENILVLGPLIFSKKLEDQINKTTCKPSYQRALPVT